MTPPSLDEAYVQRHARPGEDWAQARDRLAGEVFQRYCLLPACEVCAAEADNADIAAERHRLGNCARSLTVWPETALSQRLFDAAVEQSALHTQVQAALVRANIESRLKRISNEQHPINAVRAACTVGGYIRACEDLCLFEPAQIAAWLQEAHLAHQQAEADFVQQFHRRDPEALPWRSAKKAP